MPWVTRGGALLAVVLFAAAPAAARDYAGTALNIIPSGQFGSVPVPPGADAQAKRYDALTPLGGDVTPADLVGAFKSERFGTTGSCPCRRESVPRRGVTITRDRFDVPHVRGRDRDDLDWAAGWVTQEDRGLLLAQARYAARFAALDAPGIDAFSLVTGLKSVTPTAQAARIIDRTQTAALRAQGREGRAILHSIDLYVDGLNARMRREHAKVAPYTRVDVYSANALAGQIFGQGGGDEVRRSQLLDALRRRLGSSTGTTVFDDLSEHDDADAPTTIDRQFPYEPVPARAIGNAVIDANTAPAAALRSEPRRHASNFLMVGRQRSANGRPLAVMGPQIGYFYPGLTYELDLQAPGIQARGAAFPGGLGNILIGRGQGLRVVADLRRLGHQRPVRRDAVRGPRRPLPLQGPLPDDGLGGRRHDRGARPGALPHDRPRAGAGLRDRRRQARRDLLQALELRARHPLAAALPAPDRRHREGHPVVSTRRPRRRPSRSTSPTSTTATSRRTPPGGCRSATRASIRACRRGAPARSSGAASCPRWTILMRPNPPSGELVNWNNKPAQAFGAADDEWSYGSIQRVAAAAGGARGAPDARPRLGDRRHEPGGHAGPACRRLTAARTRPRPRDGPGAQRPLGADARAARRLAGGGRKPPGPRPRRQDGRRGRPRDHGRRLPARRRRRPGRRARAPARPGHRHPRPHERPAQRLHRRPDQPRRQGPAPAHGRALSARRFGPGSAAAGTSTPAGRRCGRPSRTRAPRSKPHRGRPIPTPGRRTPRPSGSPSPLGCSGRRSATPTARAVSSRSSRSRGHRPR